MVTTEGAGEARRCWMVMEAGILDPVNSVDPDGLWDTGSTAWI